MEKFLQTISGKISILLPNGRPLSISGGNFGLSEIGFLGGDFSLSSSSLSRMGFSADPPISKSSRDLGEWKVPIPHLKTTSTSNWSFSQRFSIPSRWESCSALMSISCAPTLEKTSSLISIVPSWLGVNGTHARWVFRKSYLWDNNKLQGARGFLRELLVTYWTRSFTVRVTESRQNPRGHSKLSLKSGKMMLL